MAATLTLECFTLSIRRQVVDGDDQRTKSRISRASVWLLPLPTGTNNLQRLKPLFRYDIYRRFYADVPGTERYLDRIKPLIAANPRWFDEEVAALGVELLKTVHYVYSSRDKPGTPP